VNVGIYFNCNLFVGFVKPQVIARNPLKQAMSLGNGGRVTW